MTSTRRQLKKCSGSTLHFRVYEKEELRRHKKHILEVLNTFSDDLAETYNGISRTNYASARHLAQLSRYNLQNFYLGPRTEPRYKRTNGNPPVNLTLPHIDKKQYAEPIVFVLYSGPDTSPENTAAFAYATHISEHRTNVTGNPMPGMLYIEYIFKRQICTGGGGRLLAAIEAYAKTHEYTYVGLAAVRNAITFYDNMGYLRSWPWSFRKNADGRPLSAERISLRRKRVNKGTLGAFYTRIGKSGKIDGPFKYPYSSISTNGTNMPYFKQITPKTPGIGKVLGDEAVYDPKNNRVFPTPRSDLMSAIEGGNAANLNAVLTKFPQLLEFRYTIRVPGDRYVSVTPLLHAIYRQKVGIVSLLIDMGADKHATSWEIVGSREKPSMYPRTASDLVARSRNPSLVKAVTGEKPSKKRKLGKR